MCTAASTATCQKPRDRPAWCNMLVPFSIMVLLNLSALPFCCGECGIVSICSIPEASNIARKSLLTYSPPRSECRHLIWASNCISAQALYISKACLNSDLAFKKMTTTDFEKSSKKVAKYSEVQNCCNVFVFFGLCMIAYDWVKIMLSHNRILYTPSSWLQDKL